MNYVLGQKMPSCLTRHKQQEIKFKVYNKDDAQLFRYSRIHKPKHELGEFMVKSAYSALKEVDAVLFMVNVSENVDQETTSLLEN